MELKSIKKFDRVLALVLTIAALLAGQSVWAASTFTVSSPQNNNTFRITRTGNTAVSETIDWRVVSLSAIAGVHFTGYNGNYSGTVTFNVNDTYKDVTISESNPGDNAYKYQNGTTRSYRFEVLDRNGDILASCDRSRSYGTSVPSSGAFAEKDITIYTDEVQYSDAGYNKGNNPHYINSSSYYNLSGIAPVAYYTLIGAQLRSTLSFDAKEKNNGYQYVQVLINNTSTCDDRSDCSNGDPGNINLSRYMAGFDHDPGGKNTTYAAYTFPVLSAGNNCSTVTNAWSNGVDNKLYTQKFNTSCRATDGRLILPLDFNTLVVRFNASGGGTDNDEWYAKNVKAHIQAVDATAPTVLSNYKVSGGRHQKGNVIYVSVAFSEIVTVSGTPTLATSWGTLSYCAGSGTNVLTFSGTIGSDATGTLSVTAHSGTITDLAGNALSGTVSHAFATALDDDYAWTAADFNSLGTNTYEIATKTDLRHLALLVNAAKNPCTGLTFRQIRDITCDATYIPIGYCVSNSDWTPFRGTYDGQGHTVSGITVSRTGDTSADGYVGLFGFVDYNTSTDYGTVKNVVLANSAFTGCDNVGGIVGYNGGGTVQNCRVESTVTINAGQNYAYNHGGIVGKNSNATAKVIGCYSAAAVSRNSKSNCQCYGGIVGYNILRGTVKDCLYAGTTVTSANDKGAIVGYDQDNSGVFSNNYYSAISLGGVGADGSSSDRDGARRARTVSLGTGVALSGTQTAYDVSGLTAVGTTALSHNDGTATTIYSGEGQTVNVAYTATVPEGFMVTYSATAGTLDGSALTLAAADATVSATCAPDYATHWHADADHDGTTADRAYIITTTTGLNLLATLVNGTVSGYDANDYSGTFFKLGGNITYNATTAWDNTDNSNTENNYTAIGRVSGNTNYYFKGTFDGGGHTVSGIRITQKTKESQGLFGYVGEGGTVKNVTLSNARIFSNKTGIGGIVGDNSGTITNCHVTADVNILGNGNYHGGIAGNSYYGNITGCTSAAALNGSGNYRGGITGQISRATVSDCLVIGVSYNYSNSWAGAIVGKNLIGTLTRNYYRDCSVNGATTNIGVGTETAGVSNDADGARSVHSLTLPTGVTATGESVTNGTDIYYASNTTVTLNIPTGYVMSSASYNDGTDHAITDNTFTMPAADITVSATLTDLWDITSGKDGTTAEKAYTITSTAGLDLLATLVNDGNNFDGKYFKLGADITYTNTTDWNDATSTENNYTAIGVYFDGNRRYFRGTFDGQGHTVRGIRIYKGGTTGADSYQGLFGSTSGATIRNVILADARITGRQYVGGIAGYITINAGTGGIVENCRVGSDVCIHAVADYAYSHGGVVGECNSGTISGCVSSATLTVYNGLTGINEYGGIVGNLNGDLSDCLSIDASVPDVNRNGAIAGIFYTSYTLTNNYYYNCTVGGATTNVGIGFEQGNETPHDCDGARSVHSLTLPLDVTATGESVTIGTDTYYARYTTVTLNIPTGYVMSSASYNDGTDHNITGNTFTMPASDITVSATLTDVWDITSGKDGTTAEKAYTITSTAGLDLLATLVNTGNDFDGKYFKLDADITYTHTTNWNDDSSTENNFTAIGGYSDDNWRYFRGTFDGQGHTVRGIRIYKGGTTTADSFQGLFGRTSGATIRNVILADARITGMDEVGGIAGYITDNAGTGGIVENCRVGSDVRIHAVADYAYYHGGVVGDCNGGTISGCVSSATLTVAKGLTGIGVYGGIVGDLNGDMSDCLSIDASVPAVDYNGAIAGYVASNRTLTNNYYYNCTVGGATTNVGIGFEQGNETPHDCDGARSVHSLTLPLDVTATGESVTIGTDTYYARYTTVTLNIPTGYVMSSVSYNDGTDHDITGNTFTMPAADVTVSATLTDVWDITSGKDGTTAEKAYTITSTAGLDLLATLVNGGNEFYGKYFKLGADITYTNTTDWNDATSTENNFTAIGARINDINRFFCGTFDGQGHTVRGIRIYKGGTTGADSYQGLFGSTSGATIRNVILADARITGMQTVGGIAGYNRKNDGTGGIVENCRVGSDVCIHAVVDYARYHGGVVGNCNGGTISGCVSSATLTVANDLTGISAYGGVVGNLNADMSDCLSIDASVPDVDVNGAIAGIFYTSYTLTNNYYYNCTVGGATTNVGVGREQGNTTPPHDRDGARSVHSLTLPTGVTATGESVEISGVTYYASNTTITLNCTPPVGYAVSEYIVDDTAITGNIFTMPAAVVNVSATLTDVWGIASGKDGTTAEKAYTITSTAGLDLLATLVNGGNNFDGKYFKLDADITYTHTTDWDDATSTENNYTAIGVYFDGNRRYFRGTFDGQGHTVRGIRIYKGGDTDADSYQGLFGRTSGATIRNVILADARITGKQYVGGIAGYITDNTGTGGIVENCRVGRDVCIHAVVDYAFYHGGVVGYCNGTISGCVSSATLTVANGLSCIDSYGGIVGYLNGDMSDCLTIDASVPAVDMNGAIAGNVDPYSTAINNYYYNCTVGGNAALSNTYTVSAGTDVTVAPAGDADATYEYNGIKRYGDALYYGGVLYAPRDASVSLTLGYNGSVPTDLSVGYGASVGTLSGSANPYTLTMPAGDVTINAFFGVEVPYIDEKGVEHIATAIPLDNTMTTLAAGTYVVNSDITYTSGVTTTGDVTLILGDDCTMSFGTEGDRLDGTIIECNSHNLTIYGQSGGTGWLKAYSTSYDGINHVNYYTQYSGNVVISVIDNGACIYAREFTILGGTLDLKNEGGGANGEIVTTGNINIRGGKLWARYKGLKTMSGKIILGYTNATDQIYVKIYNTGGMGVKIADGKTLVNDNGEIWSGAIHNIQIEHGINDRTLKPLVYSGVTLTKDGSGNVSATFSGSSETTVSIPVDVNVTSVTYNRTFTEGRPATVMLPFSLGEGQTLTGGTLYKFTGVTKNETAGKWEATMTETATLQANTPYLLMPNNELTDGKVTFNLGSSWSTVTLNTTGGGNGVTADEGSHWTFKGTYEYMKWTTDTSDPDYNAERAAEIGRAYGFAGVAKDNIDVGDFVKVASGAKIRPMSAYLIWSNTANLAPARGGMNAASASVDELPKSITVRLINANGTVTNVGEIDMETGELSFEGWYTLQGVKLEAEPTEPGIYINNGKKVSIK